MTERAAYFLASGVRQVLLDTALALHRGGHNRLFLAEHIRLAWIELYRDAFASWPESPFRSLQVLSADWRPQLANVPRWRRRFVKPRLKRGYLRRNRALLEQDLRAHPPAAFYVSCDTFYESQYALHLTKQLAPDAPRIYVEDGLAAYARSFARPALLEWPKEIGRFFRYGTWWRPCTLPGTSGWLHEGLLAYPAHAVADLRRLRLREFEPGLLTTPSMREFAARIGHRFGLDRAALRRADWIVTIANSRWSHLYPAYHATMARICRELLDRGLRVLIKQHPADLEQGDCLGLGTHPGLYVAPAALPIEVLFLLLDRDDVTLLGDASTTMVAARWLRPTMPAIVMQMTSDGADLAALAPMFAAIGVTIEPEPARVPGRYLEARGA